MHADEFNNQYFNRRHPLQTRDLCIKFLKKLRHASFNTKTAYIPYNKSIFHFFHILAKKIKILFGLLARQQFSFCLPAGPCQNGFNFYQIRRKPCWHLTAAPDFFIATCPHPDFLEKNSQDHQYLFETHLKREIQNDSCRKSDQIL